MARAVMSGWAMFIAEMTETMLESDYEDQPFTEKQKREIIELAKEKLEAAAFIGEAINERIGSAVKEYIEDMR